MITPPCFSAAKLNLNGRLERLKRSNQQNVSARIHRARRPFFGGVFVGALNAMNTILAPGIQVLGGEAGA